MNPSLSDAVIMVGGSPEFSLVVKATAVASAGLVASRFARRARASTRHLILAATFVILLLLPVASVSVRNIEIEVPVPGLPVATAMPTRPMPPPDVTLHGQGATHDWRRPSVRPVVRAAWVAGVMFGALWLGVGVARLHRLRRHGLPWPESRAVVATLAGSAGVRQNVEVVLHESVAAPVTCGWRRPVILLPSDAPGWAAIDLRRALVHELEHVRRGDWAVHLAARVGGTVFWFHPLVWIAFRRMCLEAERACDDAVLLRAESAGYASQLVQLARRMTKLRLQSTVGMASRSDLAARVSAILDTTQARGRLHSASVVSGLLAGVVLALAIAPLRAVGIGSPSPGTPSMRGVGAPRGQPGRSEDVADGGLAPSQVPGEPRETSQRLSEALDRALFEAAEEGGLNDISALLAAGGNVNAALAGDGSPLIGAARTGRLAAVEFLLERGADPDLVVRGDGSPLIMAAREGHVEIVEVLLDRGASIEQVAPGDENALIQASAQGHLRVVELLVARGANVNARVWAERSSFFGDSGEWRTPLSMAERGRHDDVVGYLRSAGAEE